MMDGQLLEGFMEALRDLPEVQAEFSGAERRSSPDQERDAQVDLRVGGNAVTLLIEMKKDVYPRDVRQALWQLRDSAPRSRHPEEKREAASFLIARSISPGARELLRSERVGYYDSGGSLFLPAGNIYVYVDKPPPKGMSRSIRSLFSGRRAQVLHAVLQRDREWFGVKGIANQARVSPATAWQVLTELEKFEWVVSRGQGPGKERHLQEPGALLDAWVKQQAVMRPPSMRRYFVPAARGEGLVEKFAEACAVSNAEYAITHEAAGQRYAPFLSTVSQVRCRLPGGPAADKALGALDARSADQGANLAIIEVRSPGELLFRESVNGIWLASAVQVYLDLMRSEGRATEMAKHLRQERIGF
ncbi:MAG: hypothetical protein F4Z55_11975 [Boseongicola sp. SB0667_bin_21]|nr:hypothetical protein [Boseongicola sp. SB0667_bin_21]